MIDEYENASHSIAVVPEKDGTKLIHGTDGQTERWTDSITV